VGNSLNYDSHMGTLAHNPPAYKAFFLYSGG
jgi:hypothetical protein